MLSGSFLVIVTFSLMFCSDTYGVEVKITNNCHQPVWIARTKNNDSLPPLNDPAVVKINSWS